MKRLFDLFSAIYILLVLIIPLLLITISVLLTSKSNIFFRSDRTGINNMIFKMPKFRSM